MSSVTEVKEALGAWSIDLVPSTPREVLDALTPFGTIAVVPGRFNPVEMGDGLLAEARYVGVYRSRSNKPAGTTLEGASLAFWLGDEDGKGPVFVNSASAASATFSNAVRVILNGTTPAASATIPEGTLTNVGGTFTGTFQFQSARDALTYLTDTYSTPSVPVSWRVNNLGSLDAGPDSALFVTIPKALLVRSGRNRDLSVTAVAGDLEMDTDVEDYTTRVVLLAEGEAGSTVTASASLVSPYLTPRGQAVQITRLVSEFETDAANAQTRAQLQLNRFTNPRQAVALSTDEYDIKGSFSVGDTIMVYDPDIGFVDTNRETYYRGVPINPQWLPVTELTWPIPPDWTVAYRDGLGTWTDLSAYYVGSGGATTVVVGGISRSLQDATSQPIGSRPIADSSVPATPVFTSYATSTYQTTSGSGETRGQVQLVWSTPLNTDGSTVVDGAIYTIRWRPLVSAPYPATWSQASGYTWAGVSANKWNQPLISPILDTGWHQTVVPWGTNQVLLQEFTPGVTYEFQINAADTASPANISPFSASVTVPVATDFFPPSVPAAPEVAGNPISIQVTHRLGKSSGGTFNLDSDMAYLEVHVGGSPSFYPDEGTRVGRLAATVGNIQGQIPVVGTFPITEVDQVYVKVVAVDLTGNRSTASDAATVTAQLISNQYISDLTASKITAGTISASLLISGSIRTSATVPSAYITSQGFYTYDASGVNTFWASDTGFVRVRGEVSSGPDGRRIVINPGAAGIPEIRFYPSIGGDYARVYATDNDVVGPNEAGITITSSAVTVDPATGIPPYDVRASAILNPGYARIGAIDSSSGGLAGGGTYNDQNYGYFGFFVANDPVAGFITDVLQINTPYGKWYNGSTFAPDTRQSAIMGRGGTVASGTVVVTQSYGATMQSTMAPMFDLQYSSTTITLTSKKMDNFDATGFVIRVATSAATAFNYTWWAHRYYG